jgi:regulator of RNase E activity RraB
MKVRRQSLDSLLSMNSEQTSQRVKLGDQLEAPREIEHFAYFAKRAAAESAAAELADDGMRTTISRRGFGTFALEAHTESDVELETADAFVERMYTLIDKHGGVYDGWGGPVVLKGTTT